jgi:hypothetical protein
MTMSLGFPYVDAPKQENRASGGEHEREEIGQAISYRGGLCYDPGAGGWHGSIKIKCCKCGEATSICGY